MVRRPPAIDRRSDSIAASDHQFADQRRPGDAQSGQPTRRIDIQTSIDEDGSVAFSIFDNGLGAAAADLEHIFDSFFSTKAAGRGIGRPFASRSLPARPHHFGFKTREWRCAFLLRASRIDGRARFRCCRLRSPPASTCPMSTCFVARPSARRRRCHPY